MTTPDPRHLIEWRDEFETGIRSLDHEHKELIGLINELHRNLVAEGTTEAVGDFLDEVYARISAHFALEETIMRERKYDGYREHKDDHERLLDDIRDIMDGYEAGAFTDYRDELSERLTNWFGLHFKTVDARLHRLIG